MNYLSTALLAVLLTISGIATGQQENYDKQLFRPQFHFSPEQNWQGAPASLIYLEGDYHLFYQCNPDGIGAENSHWGHAVSSDLLHWKHQPLAISPNKNTPVEDSCQIFSGSVIIDKQNLLEKQIGADPVLAAFYTSGKCGLQIAYSTDKGQTWKEYEKNPEITLNASDETNAPKVLWHENSQKWIMLLSRKLSEKDASKGISFFVSDDLINWEYKSHIPGLADQPDLVEFTVENRPNEKMWVLFSGDGSYLMGDFDGTTFTPSSGILKSDWGKNYFAPRILSNLQEEEKRVIQIASLRNGKFTDMPFNGQMSFPSELSVKKFSSGYKLLRKPIDDIENLHGKHDSWTNKNLIPGINQNIMKKVSGDCLHIRCEIDLKTSDSFGFMVRHSNKIPGVEILYNVQRGVLTTLGSTVPLLPNNNTIKLEIILDRSSLEIFANDGQAVLSSLFEGEAKAKDVVLFTTGGELLVLQADAFEINSIWENK